MESGSVSGLVTDSSGASIAGAQLTLVDIDRNTFSETKANAFGFYRFESVHPGRYRMRVEKQDFKIANVTGLIVNTQDWLEENVLLEPGSLVESTTIVVETLKLIHTNGSVGGILDKQLAISIPLNARSLQGLFTLIPGVELLGGNDSTLGVAQLAVDGQRDLSNVFSVDGVNANIGVSTAHGGRAYNSATGNIPPINAIGGTQSMVSVDELEGVRVQTSTYSAPYGNSPGGQFLLTTRSGTNLLHGSAYLFTRPNALDAHDWFQNSYFKGLENVRQWQPGGVLGGPLVLPHFYNGRGRTFFFASFETLSLVMEGMRGEAVPDPQLLNQIRSVAPTLFQVLVAGAAPNGPALRNGFGTLWDFSFRSNWTYSGALRLDHEFSHALHGFVRYADSPSVSINPGAPSFFANVSSTRYSSITAGTTWTLSSALINEFRTNYSSGSSSTKYGDWPYSIPSNDGSPVLISNLLDFAPSHYDPKSYLVLFSVGSGSNGEFIQQGTSSTKQDLWQISDTLFWNHGEQALKFGFEGRWLHPVVNYFKDQATYYFLTGVSDQPDIVSTGNVAIAQIAHSNGLRPLLRNYALFVDDTWRVTPKLSIDYGLRWESVHLPLDATGLNGAVPSSNSWHYQSSYEHIAPRLGIAYSVRSTPRWETVLRLGSGAFYDISNGSALALLGDAPFSVTRIYRDVPFPLTGAQLDVAPNPTSSLPPTQRHAPVTYSWSAAIDQTLGNSNRLLATYVANEGQHLLGTQGEGMLGYGSAPAFELNSNYEAFQLQFRQRLSNVLQTFAAYTWAHTIDDATVYQGGAVPYVLSRGNSDIDLRHVVRVGGTYTVPRIGGAWPARHLLNGWNIGLNIAFQSGAPFSVTDGSRLAIQPTGERMQGLANINREMPAWIRNPEAPRGWQINPAAFSQSAPGALGNAGRNAFRGFAVGQLDIALIRQCSLGERARIEFRAEVFNLTNHPNFSTFNSVWTPDAAISNFGRAEEMFGNSLGGLNPLRQVGGPRSIQLSVRLSF